MQESSAESEIATLLAERAANAAEAEAHRILNAVIEQYTQREFRTKGISAKTQIPTLRVSREAWDAIIRPAEARGDLRPDPACAGITEYRGSPVEVVVNDRPGIWAEVQTPTEPVPKCQQCRSEELHHIRRAESATGYLNRPEPL